MKTIRTIPAIIGAALVMAAAFATPGMAGKNVLPGVKGYNFNASPNKLRRLCRNTWGGRYWHVGRHYGCDGAVSKYGRFDIRCLVPKAHSIYEDPCVVKYAAPGQQDWPNDPRRGRPNNPGRQNNPGGGLIGGMPTHR